RKRDDHLRSQDFLAAADHPTITFDSTHVEQVEGTAFKVTGDLTVRGTTKPVTVAFDLADADHGPRATGRVRFTGTATVSRKDWGVSGAAGLVGDKVTLTFDVTAVRRS
ncbi:YceI family protein, partial [Streptomyces sp. NPDC006356]